ncbi:MAG: sigma-54-dependent transcriptional regulator [bacterium]
MKNANILIVDDEKTIREGCRDTLKKDYYVECAETGWEALNILSKNLFHIVLLDLKLPDIEGTDLLEKIKTMNPDVEIIVITAYATIKSVIETVKKGAYDYIAKPFTPDDLRRSVQKTLQDKVQQKQGKDLLKKEQGVKGESLEIIGESPKMKEIFTLVRRVAPTDSTVLICGESGTGKELIAREIYRQSLRKNNPFLAIDCGALVETLLESELFGHIKGAFTGATNTKHGCFELANGGTFLFDEIGNLSLSMQAKLLRVLQEQEIKPVGGEKMIKVDVRLIFATNKDLRKEIQKGSFREDLFYRISVMVITLPPLRERKEDIPSLSHFFLEKYNKKRKRGIERISPDVMKIFINYDWPGNVRELGNVMERAVIMEDSNTISASSIPSYLFSPKAEADKSDEGLKSLEQLEKEHILMALKKTSYHKSNTAKILGIDRKTLHKKIEKHKIQ